MIFQLKILQLDETATIEDIKRQYRKLSKEYHPDLNPGIDPKLFLDLTTAYDWLLLNYEKQDRVIEKITETQVDEYLDAHEIRVYVQKHIVEDVFYAHINIPIYEVERNSVFFVKVLNHNIVLELKVPAGTKMQGDFILYKGQYTYILILN